MVDSSDDEEEGDIFIVVSFRHCEMLIVLLWYTAGRKLKKNAASLKRKERERSLSPSPKRSKTKPATVSGPTNKTEEAADIGSQSKVKGTKRSAETVFESSKAPSADKQQTVAKQIKKNTSAATAAGPSTKSTAAVPPHVTAPAAADGNAEPSGSTTVTNKAVSKPTKSKAAPSAIAAPAAADGSAEPSGSTTVATNATAVKTPTNPKAAPSANAATAAADGSAEPSSSTTVTNKAVKTNDIDASAFAGSSAIEAAAVGLHGGAATTTIKGGKSKPETGNPGIAKKRQTSTKVATVPDARSEGW